MSYGRECRDHFTPLQNLRMLESFFKLRWLK
jgi:hypothetical protein